MDPHKHMPASTLPEVLVLMIISGILFLGLMDGLRLFTRLGNSLSQRIGAGSVFYDNYERLGLLIASSDSLVSRRGALEVYRAGAPAFLKREDSLLLVRFRERSDTLFRTLVTWDTLTLGSRPFGIDTLLIRLAAREDSTITLRFGRHRPDPRPLDHLLETETDYRYD